MALIFTGLGRSRCVQETDLKLDSEAVVGREYSAVVPRQLFAKTPYR